MKTWSNGAKKRMVEIQADRDSANDMRTIAAAFAQLPPGQLKKLLTDDVLAILEKYGLAVE
ncbi:MAG: hypothetical protein ACI3WQ_08840 [Faecousia sp.]